MSVRLWTARLGAYREEDALDVSRQGNSKVKRPGGHRGLGIFFAPSWDLLAPYLRAKRAGLLTDAHWSRYVTAYTAEMRDSLRRHRVAWEAVLALDVVTLTCFCANERRCHRRVLAGLFVALGAEDLGERDRPPRPQRDLFEGLGTGAHP